MATVRKRGARWYAEVRILGQRQGRTFSTRGAAKAWADQAEDQIRVGSANDTLRAVLQRYSDEVSPTKRGARWEQTRLTMFARVIPFADQPAASITPDQVGQWRDARLTVVGAGTVRRELSLLASVFEMARREWRLIHSNPLRDVRKPKAPAPRTARISDEQANLIFAAAGYVRGNPATDTLQLAAAAFDLALATAMRAGEIVGLRGENIHLARRFVHLPLTKNGASRDVPLSSIAGEILAGLDADHPFPISGPVLDATFRKLKARVGLAGQFTFHDARAEATTRLSRKLDAMTLAKVTGHKDLKMLLNTYYRESAEELAGRLD